MTTTDTSTERTTAVPETDVGVSHWTCTRLELIEALLASLGGDPDATPAEVADAILSRLTPMAVADAGALDLVALLASTTPAGTAPGPPTDAQSIVDPRRLHGIVNAAAAAMPAAPEPGGYFASIMFFGHLEHTGYVTEITTHGGVAAYRVELPEKLWGGNPLAVHEYAASSYFGKHLVTEESVRTAWEAERERAEKWRLRQAEWERRQSQPALPAGETGCGCTSDEECDECADAPDPRPF